MSDTNTYITGYARLTPPQARVVLVAILLVALLGAIVTLSPMGSSNLDFSRDEAGDIPLYRAEVERIHDGEGYYTAAAVELAERGYPTRSIFNWRTPLPMWLIGKMPALVLGKAVLGVLAIVLLLLAFEATAREEERLNNGKTDGGGFRMARPVGCVLLLTGPLLPVFLGDLFYLPVLWAGVLIAISICCYGISRPWLAVMFGLAAVFCRELAMPYCLLCAAMALRERRRGELTAWLVGLAAWIAFFALHGWLVSGLISPDARAHSHGWLQFGGAGFVISTAQMNAYLLLVPQWVTALFLAAALVGLAGWSSPLGTRIGLTVCLYLAAFAAVGQSFNQYWGALIAPLLCFGVVRFPASIRELLHAARSTTIRAFTART